jgi:PilZ domain
VANTLHSSIALSATQRTNGRQRVAMPARLTWKDQGGSVRFASVVTRDVSETGAFVECASVAPIPLFRLVHLQLETPGAAATPLAAGRVLAAVWRVEREPATGGSPAGYALRFMVDPAEQAVAPRYVRSEIAAAS